MKKKALRAYIAALLLAALALPSFAQDMAAKVSEKQPLAIFALGSSASDIGSDQLGLVDAQIMAVFTDLKRFEVMGLQQRLSSTDFNTFISDLKKFKEKNMTIPEKYLLGEAFLTDAELEKLIGAFYIVLPVVTSLEQGYDSKAGEYKATLNTSFTFLDVAKGVTMAAPVIKTGGSDKKSQAAATREAIESIPIELQFEARKVFPLDSKVVKSDLFSVKMRLGSNMGVKKGYEFAVIQKDSYDGIVDEKEKGLVIIRDVGSEFSDGTIIFSDMKIGPETQLREIPRMGFDASAYYHHLMGANFTYGINTPEYTPPTGGFTAQPGIKVAFSNGFYDFRPILGVQVPVNGVLYIPLIVTVVPINMYVGGEFNLYLGRLQIVPWAAVGGTGFYVSVLDKAIVDEESGLSHFGAIGGVDLSLLLGRDFKLRVEAGGEYWASVNPFVKSYYGVYLGGGITIKM